MWAWKYSMHYTILTHYAFCYWVNFMCQVMLLNFGIATLNYFENDGPTGSLFVHKTDSINFSK